MTRYTPPLSQEFDASGNPLAGALLYFYATGTSTPKDTFSDSTLATANTNPVVADSGGRFDDIFLESGQYKVVLKNSGGTEIWTADPVDGGSGTSGAVDELSANYSITIADATKLLNVSASGAARTITLLPAATAADGYEITIKKSDSSANTVTIDGNGSETIDGAATFVLRDQYDWITIRCDASNWQIVARGRGTVTQAAAEAGTSTVPYEWTPQRVGQAISSLVSLPRSYLAGLGMTNGSDASHDIDVAAGTCRDAANAADITLSAITKQIDVTWSVGTNAGGLSSSLTAPANATWYHVFAIIVAGTADVGFDTSITAANLVADHSATSYRRIGSVLTDSSANILAFLQFGDDFRWAAAKNDLSNGTIANTGTTLTLSVPTGLRVIADFAASQGTSAHTLSFFPGDMTGFAAGLTAPPVAMVGMQNNVEGVGQVRCFTNTSAQVKAFSDSSASDTDASVTTYGWLDRRGKDA